MQLNKYLALCGLASRRQANEIIQSGRIRVNGRQVEHLGVSVDPENDSVTLDRKPVRLKLKKKVILLNKPAKTLTTVSDDFGRKTVIDLIPLPERLYPVGRLDLDTTGVLLLTNDGDLAYRLTHPRYEIKKLYRVEVSGSLEYAAIQKLQTGVDIGDGVVVKGEVQVRKKSAKRTVLEIQIHEGKKRQIKRMLKAVGFPVLKLERIVFAGLTVRGMERGEWRELTAAEVKRLYRMTGLDKLKRFNQ